MMEIIDAISVRLNEVFGEDYTIYLEQVEQGLQTPCFFIQPIESTDKNMISIRKYRTNTFVITFIPSGTGSQREQLVQVANRLLDHFDSFDLGNGVVLPTFDRSIDVADGTLNFILAFKYYKYKNGNSDDMQESLDMSVMNNG